MANIGNIPLTDKISNLGWKNLRNRRQNYDDEMYWQKKWWISASISAFHIVKPFSLTRQFSPYIPDKFLRERVDDLSAKLVQEKRNMFMHAEFGIILPYVALWKLPRLQHLNETPKRHAVTKKPRILFTTPHNGARLFVPYWINTVWFVLQKLSPDDLFAGLICSRIWLPESLLLWDQQPLGVSMAI